MNRRRLLKNVGFGLVAGPALMSRALRAAEAEKITVRLDWVTWGGHSPFYLALKKGWYKDAGLDVTIEEGNGSVTTIQLVNSGNFDVGHANLAAMMQAKVKGLSVRAIAGFVRKNDVGVLVPVDSPWKTPKDLAGKKLLYTAGSLEAPFIDKFLASGGLTRQQVELVSVDAASKNTLFVKGAADGEFTSVPYALPYTSARPARGILFADNGMQFPGFGLISTDDKIKARGAAIGKFATLVSAAWQYIVGGHENEGVQAIMDARAQQKLDPAILRSQIDAFKPYFTSDASKDLPIGVMAPEDWQLAIKTMREVGLLPQDAKADDFYTNSLLDAGRIKQLGGA
ncbi:MAG TPA: ABC transporter substrate-binding protein [Alphaproteobacteria bacterium]|nr:ABC transporter substrate-binding protein [Alphaproteobacteria bacterium]